MRFAGRRIAKAAFLYNGAISIINHHALKLHGYSEISNCPTKRVSKH